MAYSHMAYIHMGRKHEPTATSVRGAHLPPSLLVKRKGDSGPNSRAGRAKKTGTELPARVSGLLRGRGWNGLKTAGIGMPPPHCCGGAAPCSESEEVGTW